jgi:predicted  nucleic acid-binding Zn-ribbon protein
MGRAARERGDIARAEESHEALEQELRALEDAFEEALASVRDEAALETECEEMLVRPRKTDLSIERVVLVWTPWRVGPDGIAEPAS